MPERPVVEMEPEDMNAWSGGVHSLMYHHPPLPPMHPDFLATLHKCRHETPRPPEGKMWRGMDCAMEN